MTKRLLLLTALLALSACSTLQNLNIVNPTYSLRNIEPHVNLAIPPSMDFDVTVGVDNPNPVGLRLDRFDFNLLVNDNNVANGTTFDRVSIPARGIGDVRLRTHVSYDNIKSIFREVADLIQGNRARYAVRGTAVYNTPIGQMQFPVTVER